MGKVLEGNGSKDFMSYENATLDSYLYREFHLTQFLEQLPKGSHSFLRLASLTKHYAKASLPVLQKFCLERE